MDRGDSKSFFTFSLWSLLMKLLMFSISHDEIRVKWINSDAASKQRCGIKSTCPLIAAIHAISDAIIEILKFKLNFIHTNEVEQIWNQSILFRSMRFIIDLKFKAIEAIFVAQKYVFVSIYSLNGESVQIKIFRAPQIFWQAARFRISNEILIDIKEIEKNYNWSI